MCENRGRKEDDIASPVRQVVALMILAALLFFVAGLLNGVYPGGVGWFDHGGFAWITYIFGGLNVLVALWIWRGSERGLLTRIVLAAVFLAIVVVLALTQPTMVSFVIYIITGLIEVVIFIDAIRVWRLGRAAETGDLQEVFALDTQLPLGVHESFGLLVGRTANSPAVLSARLTWAIGLLSLALAALLVADGVASGFIPGGTEWGFYGRQSGWLVYVFALVALTVAVRAVNGSALSLRLLLATGLIIFVERMFSAVAGTTTAGLALRLITALLGLAMAGVSAVSLRSAERARRATTRIWLPHAAGGE